MKHTFEKSFGGRENYWSCKFKKDYIGDCVIRAVALGTEQDYKKVYEDLFETAKEIGDLPNGDATVDLYMERLGWTKHSPKTIPGTKRKYMIGNVPLSKSKNHIIRCSGHLVAIVKGVVMDIWDVRGNAAQSYYSKH